MMSKIIATENIVRGSVVEVVDDTFGNKRCRIVKGPSVEGLTEENERLERRIAELESDLFCYKSVYGE